MSDMRAPEGALRGPEETVQADLTDTRPTPHTVHMERTEGSKDVEWLVVDGSGAIQAAGFITPRDASAFIGQMYDDGFNGTLSVVVRGDDEGR